MCHALDHHGRVHDTSYKQLYVGVPRLFSDCFYIDLFAWRCLWEHLHRSSPVLVDHSMRTCCVHRERISPCGWCLDSCCKVSTECRERIVWSHVDAHGRWSRPRRPEARLGRISEFSGLRSWWLWHRSEALPRQDDASDCQTIPLQCHESIPREEEQCLHSSTHLQVNVQCILLARQWSQWIGCFSYSCPSVTQSWLAEKVRWMTYTSHIERAQSLIWPRQGHFCQTRPWYVCVRWSIYTFVLIYHLWYISESISLVFWMGLRRILHLE